jgi:hypothetical protein
MKEKEKIYKNNKTIETNSYSNSNLNIYKINNTSYNTQLTNSNTKLNYNNTYIKTSYTSPKTDIKSQKKIIEQYEESSPNVSLNDKNSKYEYFNKYNFSNRKFSLLNNNKKLNSGRQLITNTSSSKNCPTVSKINLCRSPINIRSKLSPNLSPKLTKSILPIIPQTSNKKLKKSIQFIQIGSIPTQRKFASNLLYRET